MTDSHTLPWSGVTPRDHPRVDATRVTTPAPAAPGAPRSLKFLDLSGEFGTRFLDLPPPFPYTVKEIRKLVSQKYLIPETLVMLTQVNVEEEDLMGSDEDIDVSEAGEDVVVVVGEDGPLQRDGVVGTEAAAVGGGETTTPARPPTEMIMGPGEMGTTGATSLVLTGTEGINTAKRTWFTSNRTGSLASIGSGTPRDLLLPMTAPAVINGAGATTVEHLGGTGHPSNNSFGGGGSFPPAYAVTKSKSVDGKGCMIHAKFLCEYVSCG